MVYHRSFFLATSNLHPTVFIPLCNRNLEPHLDQMQQVTVHNPPRAALREFAVRDCLREVETLVCKFKST